MPTSLTPLVLIGPLMIATIIHDLRRMRIPDSCSLAVLVVFALTAFLWPPQDLTARLMAAAVVFCLGYLAFGFHLVGGGDVKILTVLMLFIPTPTLILFANVLSVSLLLGIAFLLTLRRLPVTDSNWTGIWGSSHFPMGLSIGLAGLTHPWVVLALMPG